MICTHNKRRPKKVDLVPQQQARDDGDVTDDRHDFRHDGDTVTIREYDENGDVCLKTVQHVPANVAPTLHENVHHDAALYYTTARNSRAKRT